MKLIQQLRNTVTVMLDDALAKQNLSQREYAQFFLRLKNLEVKSRMTPTEMSYAATVIEDVSKEFTMLMKQRNEQKRKEKERSQVELRDINHHLAQYA